VEAVILAVEKCRYAIPSPSSPMIHCCLSATRHCNPKDHNPTLHAGWYSVNTLNSYLGGDQYGSWLGH